MKYESLCVKENILKNQSIPPRENNLWHLYLDGTLLPTKTVMANNKAY